MTIPNLFITRVRGQGFIVTSILGLIPEFPLYNRQDSHFDAVMVQLPPSVTISPLDRADGSAAYSSVGYSVIGGVNGPVEVRRRDELPEEAAIDVAIRPRSGAGGTLDQSR